MEKQLVRKKIREQKKQLTKKEISENSKLIMDKLKKNSCFLESEALYCYVSYNQEVETRDLISYACSIGKKVAVPKVEGKEMEFYYIDSLDDLEVGYQGILEPITTKKAMESKVCLLMPGLAFDTSKNRVGYGGGFYDRYLAAHKDTVFHKLAVAFDFQVVDSIETEEFDEKVDMIITPIRVI